MMSEFNLTKTQKEELTRLIKEGQDYLNRKETYNSFTSIKEADDLFNELDKYPHLFVLGCVMDLQIKAERAWIIPYLIMKELGGFEFKRLLKLNQKDLERKFQKEKFHRFNAQMAKRFYLAIQKIEKDYQGDASKIWKESSSAAAVVRKFLEFEGIGQKIASMATNILVRTYKIPLKDLSAIDISTDTHIMRMMKKLGFAPENASREYVIFRAKEFYPSYPGILDIGLFKMGREEREKGNKQKDVEEE